jgi:hypothetical protein
VCSKIFAKQLNQLREKKDGSKQKHFKIAWLEDLDILSTIASHSAKVFALL